MFAQLQRQFDIMFQAGLQSQQAQMISFISGIFILAGILWVTCHGLLAMAGKTEAPIKDAIFKMVGLSIIYAFATEPQWINLIPQLVDGLKEALSIGGDNALGSLDALIDSVGTNFKKIESKLSIWEIGQAAGLVFFFIFETISIVILAVVTAIPLIINEITLKFLLAVSPLFIFCLSFQLVRGMFNTWLQLVFSSVIYFVFLNLVIGNAIHFSDHLDLGEKGSFVQGINMLISTLFMAKVIGILKELSSSIATVSADAIASAMGTRANAKLGRATATAGRAAGRVGGRAAVALGKKAKEGIKETYAKINPLVKELLKRFR